MVGVCFGVCFGVSLIRLGGGSEGFCAVEGDGELVFVVGKGIAAHFISF